MSLLDLLLLAPVAGALLVLFLGSSETRIRALTLSASLTTLTLALVAAGRAPLAGPNEPLLISHAWVHELGISLILELQGASGALALLTASLVPFVVLAEWKALGERHRTYAATFLVFEAAALGAFLSRDAVFFWIFSEAMLWSLAILVGVFGNFGDWDRNENAGVTRSFFLTASAGNAVILLVFLYCARQYVVQTGSPGTDVHFWEGLVFFPSTERWLLGLAFLGFAARVPLLPFPFWIRGGARSMGLGGAILLTAVFVKAGLFGLFRFVLPVFPDAARSFALPGGIVAALTVLGGAWLCWRSPDGKGLVASATASQMGLVVLALFSFERALVEGALFHLVAHGVLAAAALVLLLFFEERPDARRPWVALLAAGSLLALAGAPGFGGFWLVERLLLQSNEMSPFLRVASAFGVAGVVLALLRASRRVLREGWQGTAGLRPVSALRRAFIALPLLLIIVWMGVAPGRLFAVLQHSVSHFVSRTSAPGVRLE